MLTHSARLEIRFSTVHVKPKGREHGKQQADALASAPIAPKEYNDVI